MNLVVNDKYRPVNCASMWMLFFYIDPSGSLTVAHESSFPLKCKAYACSLLSVCPYAECVASVMVQNILESECRFCFIFF
jgi:hypothetical protein